MCRWEGIIQMSFKEMKCEVWTESCCLGLRQAAVLVKEEINWRIAENSGNFLAEEPLALQGLIYHVVTREVK